MAFHVGQKVVCVDDEPRFPWPTSRVKRGKVYTVTHIFSDWLSVEVAEAEAWGKTGFWRDRFRPIVETKTDISIFTAMLTGKRRCVNA